MKHIDLNFKQSLKIGNKREKYVKDYFEEDYDFIQYNDNYEYDLLFYKNQRQLLVEVKYDDMMLKTNNFAIECYSRGKISGIYTTTSDYWIQVDQNNEMYIIDTIKLRSLCKQREPIQTRCKDSFNKIFLIPKHEYISCSISKNTFRNII